MLPDNTVLTTLDRHVLTITINRPEHRNAVNQRVHEGIGAAIERAERDQAIRVVVLTGAGDAAFCAGMDLKAFAAGESPVPDDPVRRAWGFAGIVSHPTSKPVIAAVNGAALGGGTEIVLACDLAIASERATFGLPEVTLGLFARGGGTFRAVRQMGAKAAMELMLTGDSISAVQALEYGLVNRVVGHEAVLSVAMELAHRIAANAPLAVQASKRLAIGLVDGVAADEACGWRQSEREWARMQGTLDAREGARAFAERRLPNWSGR